MSDIRSTLYINDEFSDTLSELTIQAFNASKATRILTKGVEDLSDSYDELTESLTEAQKEKAKELAEYRLADKLFAQVGRSYKKIASTIKFESYAIRAAVENNIEKRSGLIKKEMLLRKDSFQKSMKYARELADFQIEKAKLVYAVKSKILKNEINLTYLLAKRYGPSMVTDGIKAMPGALRAMPGAMLNGAGNAIGAMAGFYYNDNKLGTMLSAGKSILTNGKVAKVIDKLKWIRAIAGLYAHFGKEGLLNIKDSAMAKALDLKAGAMGLKDSAVSRITGVRDSLKNAYGAYAAGINNVNATRVARAEALMSESAALHRTGRSVERTFGRMFGNGLGARVYDYGNPLGARVADLFHSAATKKSELAKILRNQINEPSIWGFIKVKSKEFGKELSNKTSEGIAKGIGWLSSNKGIKMIESFALDMGKLLGAALIQNIAFSLLKKFKDELIGVIRAADAAIAQSFDRHILSDKFSTIHGERGVVANQRTALVADKYGLNDEVVKQLALAAGSGRIGTADFERIMALSDKIARLSPNETTENVASALIQSISGERDAGTLAGLLGGRTKMSEQLKNAGLEGQLGIDPDNPKFGLKDFSLENIKSVFNTITGRDVASSAKSEALKIFSRGTLLENQLIGAGYENALNEGNLTEALNIAEKITEQAGFTNDKYAEATDTLSNNYQAIHTNMDNIKRRLGEIYTKELEPAVKLVKEFMESEEFKRIINYVAYGVKFVGSVVNKIITAMIEGISFIEKVAIVGVIAKLYLAFRSVQAIIGFLPLIKTGLVWLLRVLGLRGLAGKLAAISVQTVKQIILNKILVAENLKRDAATGRILWKESKIALTEGALSKIKLVGKWLAVAAAVGLVLYGIYKLTDETKSFGEYISALLGVTWQFLFNGFQRLAFYIINFIPGKFKNACDLIAGAFWQLIGDIQKHFGDMFTGLYRTIAEGLEKIGAKDLAKGYREAALYTNSFGETAYNASRDAYKKIEERNRRLEILDKEIPKLTDGLKEAWDTNGKSAWKKFDSITGIKDILGEIKDKTAGLTTDLMKGFKSFLGMEDETNDHLGNIESSMSDQEELRWLKAFSDRQIMNSYSQSTSHTSTTNIYRASEQLAAEGMRRTLKSRPSKVKAY